MLEVIDNLESEGRYGTAHVYKSTLRAFQRYWREKCAGKSMLIKTAFTPFCLRQFSRYLVERMLKENSISTYMRMLRAVYNRALNARLIHYVPGLFTHVFTGIRADVKRTLLPKVMGKILLSKQTMQKELEETRSLFALLFLFRGMPFVDLVRLRKSDLNDGRITYSRQKTGKPLSIGLTAEAETLINRCTDPNPQSPYLFNILSKENGDEPIRSGSYQEYQCYQSALRKFNRQLKRLSLALGIKGKLSSYTARHTWASTAYHKKCAMGIISTALGHSSMKVTEAYLKPFENEELDRTNKMIISYVKRCATD